MTHLTITISDALLEKAIQKTSRQGISVEELIGNYLEEYVSQSPKLALSARPIGLAKGKFVSSLKIPLETAPKPLIEAEEIKDDKASVRTCPRY